MVDVVQTRLLRKQETEVSFSREIQSLRLGEGETFYGEGIMAVTKALLQSGVAYVGGYQGAPVSHLLDVMVQASDLMAERGIRHLAVTENEKIVGMLSVRDLLRYFKNWGTL